jgi:hypothetical protein
LFGDFLGFYLHDLSLPVIYRLVPELRYSSHRLLFGYFELSLMPSGVVTLICDVLLALQFLRVHG